MTDKNSNKEQKTTITVKESFTKTETILKENKKTFTIVGVAIGVLVIGIMAYINFVYNPNVIKGKDTVWAAEQNLVKDSFNLALYGDDANAYGFDYTAKKYGNTPSGVLATYGAGISALNIGDYALAIKYLKDINETGTIMASVAKIALGDAYAELGKAEKAVSSYKKALDANKDDFSSPIALKKLGLTLEEMKEFKKANNAYTKLELEYPFSDEARNIKKYISRTEALSK
jgi:tetratricopeptide (TPR) repeat protein